MHHAKYCADHQTALQLVELEPTRYCSQNLSTICSCGAKLATSTFPVKIPGTAQRSISATNCSATCGTATSTICSQVFSEICTRRTRLNTLTVAVRHSHSSLLPQVCASVFGFVTWQLAVPPLHPVHLHVEKNTPLDAQSKVFADNLPASRSQPPVCLVALQAVHVTPLYLLSARVHFLERPLLRLDTQTVSA